MERNSSTLDEQLQIPEHVGRGRLTKVLLAGAVVAVLIAFGVYFLRPKPTKELYLVRPAVRRDIVQRIEAAGRIDVRRRVEIPSPVEGRLVSIHVRAGDNVQAGQRLAVLDERAAELALRTAQASEQAARSGSHEADAAAAGAARAFEQARRLRERGLATDNDVENAETELTRARAALTAARAQQRVASEGVASAQLSKSLSEIVASEGGVVLRAPERVGAAVSPEVGPLFIIGAPLELMRVDAKVNETDIALLREGQSAQVTVAALENKTFTAKVERRGIEPEVELGAVLYPVTLLVDNPERLLLPGMSARVLMDVKEAKGALAVHEAALRFVPEDADPAPPRTRVFRQLGPDRLEPVAVRPGITDGMYTAVEPVNGAILNEGDPLAIGFARPDQGTRGPRVTLGDKK